MFSESASLKVVGIRRLTGVDNVTGKAKRMSVRKSWL